MTGKASRGEGAREWRAQQSRTNYVMTVLEHLLLDFSVLGKLEEAGPHVQALIELMAGDKALPASRSAGNRSRAGSGSRTRRHSDAAE